MLILDTDLLTIVSRGPAIERDRLLAHFQRAGDENVAVTIVSFEEQMRGWLAVIAKAKSAEQLSSAYARLGEVLTVFGELRVLALDVEAAGRFLDLRRKFRRHGAADLKIAAIAVGNEAILLTRNVRDFEGIDGLSVENPLP